MKNLLLINRYMMILLLSHTCAGSIHDKRLADAYNRTRLTGPIKKILAAWLRWRRS